MGFYLGPRSLFRLRGVHPDLVAVVRFAIQMKHTVDFTVVEGLRTQARQARLFAAGASKTMFSRHLTGKAVDLAPIVDGRISWSTPAFYPLKNCVFTAAAELNVKIRWGGDWNGNGERDETFFDAPHFELPRAVYADEDVHHRSIKAAGFMGVR